MRVLFTTTPGPGHVHPMVPLARAFADGGAEVAWAAASEVCIGLRAEGFEAYPSGMGDAASWGEFHRRFPEVESLPLPARPAFMFPRLFGGVRAAPMLRDLLPIVKEWAPSVIVHDAGEFAAPVAAAVVAIPNVTHGFGALVDRDRVAGVDEQVAPIWEANGLEARPYGGCYDDLYLDIYPPSLRSGPAPHVPVAQLLRPVAFAMGGEEPVPEWLSAPDDRPLVYVTFGTVFNTDVALVGRVVEAVRELPVRVVITVGPNGDPKSLGDQPDHVHVARYLPQTQVLPACAAVVSHAGSGTLLASLAHGLPQLCLPQGADQFGNAAACARAGAGIALEPGGCSVSAVRDAAERMLSDPAIRAAAEKLSAEIAAMPDPSAVAEIIQRRFGL
jgi:UDP:flavonoid glycosyltransferase YjiC (YdhE family)